MRTKATDVEEFEDHARDVVPKAEETAMDASPSWADAASEWMPTELGVVRDVVLRTLDLTEEVLVFERRFVAGVIKTLRDAA